jgi:hypothetical protein
LSASFAARDRAFAALADSSAALASAFAFRRSAPTSLIVIISSA